MQCNSSHFFQKIKITYYRYIFLGFYHISRPPISEIPITPRSHSQLSSLPHETTLPEYFTADNSRPPTPNFADQPIRVDDITIYDPKNDPRFPTLTERFITTNGLLPNKRKETALKRIQNTNIQMKFEGKVKFQGLKPLSMFHVAKMGHKTIPVPFEVTNIDNIRDPQLLAITYSQIVTTPIQDLIIQHPFNTKSLFSLTNITLYFLLFYITQTIPFDLIETEIYPPSDDPNITNIMVSQYDCAKQHNFRQFKLLIVEQRTEAPSNIQHNIVQARVYVRANAKRIKVFKREAYAIKERTIRFQGSVKYRRVDRAVGIITQCQFLLPLIL